MHSLICCLYLSMAWFGKLRVISKSNHSASFLSINYFLRQCNFLTRTSWQTIKSWLSEDSLQNVCLSYSVYKRSETKIIFFLFSTAYYILSITHSKNNSSLSYCLLFFSGTSDLLTNLRWKDSIHWIKVKEQKIIKVELSNKSTAEAMKK